MFPALTVLFTLASPLDGDLPELVFPAELTPEVAHTLVSELTSSPEWLRHDPTWRVAADHVAVAHRFGPRQIVRITPRIDSAYGLIPVEGADRVVTVRDGRVVRIKADTPLKVHGRFVLSENEAVTVAASAVPASIGATGSARPVFVRLGDGVRAAWRVRVPAVHIERARDVWVDAESGVVLRAQPVARFHQEVRP